jgi:hypothetical protein
MSRIARTFGLLAAGVTAALAAVYATPISALRGATPKVGHWLTAPGQGATLRLARAGGAEAAPIVIHPARTRSTIACSTSLTSVSPCTVGATQFTNRTGLTQVFTVTNRILSEPATYLLSCAVAGSASSCSVPTSLLLNPNSSGLVTVTYATGAAGQGTVTLTVDDGSAPVVATINLTVVAPPPATPFHLVTLSPHYESLEDDASQVDTAAFALKNSGTETAWFSATLVCAAAAASRAVAHLSLTARSSFPMHRAR